MLDYEQINLNYAKSLQGCGEHAQHILEWRADIDTAIQQHDTQLKAWLPDAIAAIVQKQMFLAKVEPDVKSAKNAANALKKAFYDEFK